MRKLILSTPDYSYRGVPMKTTGDFAATLFVSKMGEEAQEVFWVVPLAPGLETEGPIEIARGAFSSCEVPIPAILAAVLVSGCDRFYVAHNHPTGKAKPSEKDLHLTQAIAAAADACDLYFEDHLIVAGGDWYSFVEHKLMTPREYPE